jgi:20S proteasome alpha/beta subunit
MTAIVGITDGNTVVIAGDSAGVGGLVTRPRLDEKVFTNGPYVIGYTTSFRMGQLLRYAFKAPVPPEGEEGLHAFMCTSFINSVREGLKEGGWASKNNDQEEGGSFLVGVRGRLFEIEEDYQVGELVDGYAAVGCGAEIALGALHATSDTDMSLEARAIAALEAAAHFSTGVRAPFTVVDTAKSEGGDQVA